MKNLVKKLLLGSVIILVPSVHAISKESIVGGIACLVGIAVLYPMQPITKLPPVPVKDITKISKIAHETALLATRLGRMTLGAGLLLWGTMGMLGDFLR